MYSATFDVETFEREKALEFATWLFAERAPKVALEKLKALCEAMLEELEPGETVPVEDPFDDPFTL